jgi:hypothetical protein
MRKLIAQAFLARDGVRTTLEELHLYQDVTLLMLRQICQQQLAHRGAVRRQSRARGEPEVDLALPPTEAPSAIDVQDLGPVEHRQVDRVGGPLTQLLQVGVRVLTQTGGVQRGHPEVGYAQTEAVLARGALLHIAERYECYDVAVRRTATHAKLVGDVGDPQNRPLGRKAAQNREAPLKRLRVPRLFESRNRTQVVPVGADPYAPFAHSGHWSLLWEGGTRPGAPG